MKFHSGVGGFRTGMPLYGSSVLTDDLSLTVDSLASHAEVEVPSVQRLGQVSSSDGTAR